MIWITFLLGVLTIPPILLLAQQFSPFSSGISDPYARELANAFLQAAIPEELCKWLVLALYATRQRAFDEPMDGLVYGAVASIGFATLENVAYVTEGGMGVGVLRALTAVPGHAFMGAIMGYFIGQARLGDGSRAFAALASLAVPTVLHGLYDFPLFVLQRVNSGEIHDGVVDGAFGTLAFAVLAFEWLWVRRLVKRLRAGQQASLALEAARSGRPRMLEKQKSITGLGKVLAVFGALVATAGGVVTLGVLADLVLGAGLPPGDGGEALLGGTLLIGVVPLWAGVFVFLVGLRKRVS